MFLLLWEMSVIRPSFVVDPASTHRDVKVRASIVALAITIKECMYKKAMNGNSRGIRQWGDERRSQRVQGRDWLVLTHVELIMFGVEEGLKIVFTTSTERLRIIIIVACSLLCEVWNVVRCEMWYVHWSKLHQTFNCCAFSMFIFNFS